MLHSQGLNYLLRDLLNYYPAFPESY